MGIRIYVLMEDDPTGNPQPVGVTKSKTNAERWIFSMNHDYAGPFELEEPDTSSPRAPEEAHGATPVQNLLRNLETIDRGLSETDKTLRKQVENLEQTLKKRFKSSLLTRPHDNTSV